MITLVPVLQSKLQKNNPLYNGCNDLPQVCYIQPFREVPVHSIWLPSAAKSTSAQLVSCSLG